MTEVKWSAKVDSGEVLSGNFEWWVLRRGCGNFSEYAFEFGEARIACDNKGAGIKVMGGLVGLDGMSMEGMVNLFGYDG